MLMVRWLRYKASALRLTKWECQFLKDIKRKTKLSVLQDAKIREIYGRYRHNERSETLQYNLYKKENYPIKSSSRTYNSPYCKELGVSYDEVHDFDR